MFFILLFLFFPCALVGAFVTTDEHDITVTAFQTTSRVFSVAPLAGACEGLFSTAVKDNPPSRSRQGSSFRGNPRGEDHAPAVSMLISTTAITFYGADESGSPSRSSSSDIIWPENGGGGGAALKRNEGSALSRHRCARSLFSNTALRAMCIPPRCSLPSVDLLREAYGRRRNFWGDLTAAETRRFYHELLPVSLLVAGSASVSIDSSGRPYERDGEGDVFGLAAAVDAFAEELECVFGTAETLEEKARLASMARHAAKLYVRERCQLPARVVAHVYDGLRHLKTHGSFRVTGITFEELWEKYEKQILIEDPSLEGEDLKTRVCLKILEKSCSTNGVLNTISGCSELNDDADDANNDNDQSGGGSSVNGAAPFTSDEACYDSASRVSAKVSRENAVVNAYEVEPGATEDRAIATALNGIPLQPSGKLLEPLTPEKGDTSNKKRRRRRERGAFGKYRLFGRGSRSRASV